MKRLPVDVSNFPLMINNNYLYIDKTQIIHHLITKRRLYFLSRPRRFGKSLLISTLKELFSGNKKLFKDLWISKSDYKWPKHPVIQLDFSDENFETSQEFASSLSDTLDEIGKSFDIDVTDKTLLAPKFKKLITELSQKNSVVILIDEYDSPILNNIDNLVKAKAIQKVMKLFFNVIKSLDAKGYIHAVFITGVTKFSKTSIFSGLNNLNDITLEPEAAALLGYTKEELTSYFKEYADQFAKKSNSSTQKIFEDIQTWYNGYRFSRGNDKVFNPFSVIRCFDTQNITNHWLETGTPGFLMELLKAQYTVLEDLENAEISAQSLGTFEIGRLPIIPILFQAGYLTINTYNEETQQYTLTYPNQEVGQSFKRYILASLVKNDERTVEKTTAQLKRALDENNIKLFCTALKSLLANIPHNLHGKTESYYHSLFHVLMDALGLDSQSEVTSSVGRIDLVIQTKKRIFLFEFKFKSTAQLALNQIIKQRYYEKYVHLKTPITLIGLSFNVKRKELFLDWIKKDLE